MLSEEYANWFEDVDTMSLEQEDDIPVTILSGSVADQAALHGILNRIRDLGLTLLTIQSSRISNVGSDDPGN